MLGTFLPHLVRTFMVIMERSKEKVRLIDAYFIFEGTFWVLLGVAAGFFKALKAGMLLVAVAVGAFGLFFLGAMVTALGAIVIDAFGDPRR